MKSDLPKGYRWRRIDEGYQELRPAQGKTAAEIVLIEKTKRWGWYVYLPEEWFTGGNPHGIAYSLEAAKAICEAIIRGTQDPADS